MLWWWTASRSSSGRCRASARRWVGMARAGGRCAGACSAARPRSGWTGPAAYRGRLTRIPERVGGVDGLAERDDQPRFRPRRRGVRSSPARRGLEPGRRVWGAGCAQGRRGAVHLALLWTGLEYSDGVMFANDVDPAAAAPRRGRRYYSADGRSLRRLSLAGVDERLDPADTDTDLWDMFVRDLQTGGSFDLVLVSNVGFGYSAMTASRATTSRWARVAASVAAADGRCCRFSSWASNLDPDDTDLRPRTTCTSQTLA